MYWNPQWEQQSLQQAHGWNPFYNPYSPKADIFGGLSSVLGMMSQKKEMERQKQLEDEKFQWERDFQEMRNKGLTQEQQIRDLTIRDYVPPKVKRDQEQADDIIKHARELEKIRTREVEGRKTDAVTTGKAKVEAQRSAEEKFSSSIEFVKQKFDQALKQLEREVRDERAKIAKITDPEAARIYSFELEKNRKDTLNELMAQKNMEIMKLYSQNPELVGEDTYVPQERESFDKTWGDLGGGDVLGLPAEVRKAIKDNPDMPPNEILKKYAEFRSKNPGM